MSTEETIPLFTPGQCLFCPNLSSNFAESVIHMQKRHGLFVPHRKNLVVDLETLFQYLHLVIFQYQECIHCGTARTTVQAVQQHMTGKGHCNFDISEDGSEFADFYDFSEPENDEDSNFDTNGDQIVRGRAATSPRSKPLQIDEDSIQLPSGRIISRQSPTQTGPSYTQLRRRTRNLAAQLEYSPAEPDDEERSSGEEDSTYVPGMQLVSKRHKREQAMMAYKLSNMRANDRDSLMHLSVSQQRSLLLTQHRQGEKLQIEEKRRHAKINQKGNKNLYAYWATETPIYQCG